MESGKPSAAGRADRKTGTAGRVIFVNRYFHPDLSATSQMACGLTAGLAAEGFEVHVVTGRQTYDGGGAPLSRCDRLGRVEIHRVGGTRFGRGALIGRAVDYATFHLAAAAKVLRLARPGDAVVACTDPPLLSISLGLACLPRRAGLVTWLHDVFPEVATALGVGRQNGLLMRLLRALRDVSLRRARVNVAIGERMAGLLVKNGVGPERIRVIHNFAPGSEIRPQPRAGNALRDEWGIGDRFLVAYSGNLGRAHEFETILDAADRLRDRRDIAFLFVGGGHRLAAVAAEVQRRALSNVIFKPLQPAERLGESLAAADVHLVSLRPELEGLIVPSKIYGIMAAGRPAIFVGDGGGEVARLLRAHGCGWSIEPGDGAALAARLDDLGRHPEAAAAAGAAGRQAFERLYDLPLAVSAWAEALATAARLRPAAAPAEGGAVAAMETEATGS